MRRLIVNADDLGISVGTNEAIRHVHENGILTNTSLLANGPAFDHAIAQVVKRCPNLGVGLHFNLTSGPACGDSTSLGKLVDSDGRFANSFVGLAKLSVRERQFPEWVAHEFECQRLRLAEAKVDISHVDGHQHIQMIPAVFRVVNQSCRDNGLCRIRISHEPMRRAFAFGSLASIFRRLKNFPKKAILDGLNLVRCKTALKAPDRVYGIIDSGQVSETALLHLVRSLGRGVTEIITHPSQQENDGADNCPMSQDDIDFLNSPNRLLEFNSLLSDQVRARIEKQDIELVSYRQAFE